MNALFVVVEDLPFRMSHFQLSRSVTSNTTMSSIAFKPLPSHYRIGTATPGVSIVSLCHRSKKLNFLPVLEALGAISRIVGNRRRSVCSLTASVATYAMIYPGLYVTYFLSVTPLVKRELLIKVPIVGCLHIFMVPKSNTIE